MKITIDPFDSRSIREAIRKLGQYEKEFKAKETEFIRRLKEIGVSVAETGFAMADYDGINDVLIAETQNESRAAIIAYGQAVGFIEFGTGVKFREYDSSSTEFTPPPHGSYGKGKGANPKGWYFSQNEGAAGRHTFGNVPAEAMLTARDVMVERVVQVAREVWK
jgi:hypothetical protein